MIHLRFVLLFFAAFALPAQTPQAPEPQEEKRRVELNLLGKADTGAGESRRNENVQFNLVDNNALKELNVRLGATATIVNEFRPDRGYFGAEFGNAPSGGLHLTAAQRAGWHGNIFFNHLNSIFSARAFFQVGGVQPAREHRYGFRTGFRPWKGGYLSVQGGQEKLRGNVNGNVLVPRPDERTPLTGDPARRALVESYLAAYPTLLPNRTDINPRALNTNAPQVIDNNDGVIRLEQDLTARDRLLLNYNFVSQSVDAFQLVAGQNPDTDTRSHRARATWNREWNAGLQSQVSAGFDRVGSLLVPEENAVNRVISTAGLTMLGPAAIIPIDRAQNVYRAEGQVRASKGRHEWTAGATYMRRHQNGTETDAHRGYYSFSNDFGRIGIENLRHGTPSQFIVSVGDVHRGYRQSLAQWYVGDRWQASQNLTVQYGVRHEIAGSPNEVNGREEIAYGCDCNNVAPRLGLAYRMPGRLGVARGAFGVQFGDVFPVTYSQVRFSPPGSTKFAIPAPDLLDPLGAAKEGGLPPDAKGNLYQLDPELASPYAYQYNASWEPDFFRQWRLQFGYVGSRAHKLLIMWYLNRAHPVPGVPQVTATINQRRENPDLAEIRWVLNGSRGYFDAGRATLLAPRIGGLSLDVSYWFSKAIDLGADYTNTAYDADTRLSRSQWEFETHADRRARSLFDQPHSLLLRSSYEWRGWNVSGVLLLKQGTPFSVTTLDGPGFGNVDGNGGDRPNLLNTSILGRTIGNPDTSVARLPRGAFATIAPTERGGNLGVNVFRKGPIRNLNAMLERSFRARGETRIAFRAESINLLNTPQFAEPGSTFGTPEFGFITNTLNDGRTFRFGVSLAW
ncbi:MAG: hypothetical protein IPM24_07510 [Bryobacterales bacterium]|nr:hypothetical protein [Bryobacterales bacterium]